MENLKSQLLDAYLFLRKNNQSIPDHVLEFIKNSGDLQDKYDARCLELIELKIAENNALVDDASSYAELKEHLEDIWNIMALAECQANRDVVFAHAKKVKAIVDNYDLSNDDLFKCESCQQIFDIEDSVKVKEQYICTNCANKKGINT